MVRVAELLGHLLDGVAAVLFFFLAGRVVLRHERVLLGREDGPIFVRQLPEVLRCRGVDFRLVADRLLDRVERPDAGVLTSLE